MEAARDTRTVYYLTFAHTKFHLVAVEFTAEYLVKVQQGRLQPEDTLTSKWIRAFDMREDVQDVIRIVMTLIFSLQHLWLDGQYFWRPFMYQDIPVDH